MSCPSPVCSYRSLPRLATAPKRETLVQTRSPPRRPVTSLRAAWFASYTAPQCLVTPENFLLPSPAPLCLAPTPTAPRRRRSLGSRTTSCWKLCERFSVALLVLASRAFLTHHGIDALRHAPPRPASPPWKPRNGNPRIPRWSLSPLMLLMASVVCVRVGFHPPRC